MLFASIGFIWDEMPNWDRSLFIGKYNIGNYEFQRSEDVNDE